MKCKLCLADKPIEEFYMTGAGTRERVCKSCVSLVNKTLRQYERWASQDKSQWPVEYLQGAQSIADMMGRGGTPPLKARVSGMLRHMSIEVEESDVVVVSAEAFTRMLRRLDQLEAAVLDRPRPSPNIHTKWADAINKTHNPFSTEEEWQAWKGAMGRIKARLTYDEPILPSDIRDVVNPLEVDLIPWPDTCVGIYSEFIAPALQRCQLSDGYEELVAEVEDLTSRNYYELDWPLIPYDARDR